MLPTMGIIDRYLLRQFVQTFVICVLSLTGLIIVFDSLTNLEDFMRCGQKAGGFLPFMVQFYGYHSILFFDRTSSLLALVSAMFTVSWIQRHNEMTALLAAGVSRLRIVTPIVAAVAVVSLFTALNREVVIPRCRSELSRGSKDPLGDHPQSFNPRYDNRTDVLFEGKNTYADQKRIEEPIITFPSTLRKHGKRIVAANAFYLPAEGNRPAGYKLVGVREPRNLESRQSLFMDSRSVLIMPCDAPDWLKPDQCFLCSDVDFDQMTGDQIFKQLSSTPELIRALHNQSLDFGADECVAVHARIVQPLLDMTLLFLSLPLIARRESRNVFLAMGVSMVVTVVFTLTVICVQELGRIGLFFSPAQAAWVPLIIFVPVAAWLSESLRK
jgi:lipopolysaccharide export system permease protein